LTDPDSDLATVDAENKHKLSQIVEPPPSRTWVFIDEHQLSIDDGVFLIVNGDKPNGWSSYRGDRHNNGANLSFADGHAERYQWRCHRQFPVYTTSWVPAIDADDRADLSKLAAGLPREKPVSDFTPH
jgi:prepilin-type processing-associated H-X9-DG protein